MYKCCDCGKDTPNIRQSYLTQYHPGKFPDQYISRCDDCDNKLTDQIEFENETYSDDCITCPACGYEDNINWTEYIEADEEEIQCGCCNEWFVATATQTVSFSTKRVKKVEV